MKRKYDFFISRVKKEKKSKRDNFPYTNPSFPNRNFPSSLRLRPLAETGLRLRAGLQQIDTTKQNPANPGGKTQNP